MLTNTIRALSRQASVIRMKSFDASMVAPSSTSISEYVNVVSDEYKLQNFYQRRYFSDEKSARGDDNTTEESVEQASEEEVKEAASEEAESHADDKVKELEKQLVDLKNQVLRAFADQENTRTIAKKDVDSARQFAVTSFAKSLLDVSDNLTRAMEAVPEELRADKENNPVLASLYEGIHMTDQGLTKAFEKNGLMKYGAIGDAFNPNQHDALFEYPDPEKEAGTVGQVLKKGFMLHGRPIRAAEVGVVKKV